MGRQKGEWGIVALPDSMVSLIKELLVSVTYFNLIGWVTFFGKEKGRERRVLAEAQAERLCLSSVNRVKSEGLWDAQASDSAAMHNHVWKRVFGARAWHFFPYIKEHRLQAGRQD